MKSAIVFINLGTPTAPDSRSVRQFLKQFLSDQRVVEVPRAIWMCILYLIILPFRSRKVAHAYREIWMGDKSPLLYFSEKLVAGVGNKLALRFPDRTIAVRLAMSYSHPFIPDVIDELRREDYNNFLFIPLYPQYSATTTAASLDIVMDYFKSARDIPAWRWLRNYHDNPTYIETLARSVRTHWETHARGEKLLLSFHGIPRRNVDLGDPYEQHCLETAEALAEKLSLANDEWLVSFQSRLGKAEWLQPYTDKTLIKLAEEGTKSVDVLCPAFAVECLETLEEIDGEGQELFRGAGGEHFSYIPCLNDSIAHQDFFVEVCDRFVRETA